MRFGRIYICFLLALLFAINDSKAQYDGDNVSLEEMLKGKSAYIADEKF